MNKRFYIFVYCLLFTAYCFCQQTKIDSLQNILRTTKEDTIQIKTLNALSWELKQIGEYDKAMKSATDAFILSEQINFKKGKVSAYNNIGVIDRLQGNYPEAIKNYMEALKI